jgi:hypothetical protein
MAEKMLNLEALERADNVISKIWELQTAVYGIREKNINFTVCSFRKFADLFADFAEELQDIAYGTYESQGETEERCGMAAESIPKKILGLTLGEIVSRFKGLDGFERYTKMLKDLIDVDEREQALLDRKAALARQSASSNG